MTCLKKHAFLSILDALNVPNSLGDDIIAFKEDAS
jgi:hypothetical protein